MKLRHNLLFASILSLLPAAGTTLTWNSAATNNTWDTTATDIWGGSGPWNSSTPDSAVFGGTGEAVTIGTTLTAATMSFSATGYGFTGSALTLGGGAPVIDTASGVTATFSNVLAGSQGLTKTGDGTLKLAAQNTFTGTLNVNGGTLYLPTAYSGSPKSLSTSVINLAANTKMVNIYTAFGWYANNNATGLTIKIGEGAISEPNGAFGVAYILQGGAIADIDTALSSNNGTVGLSLGSSGGFSSSVTTLASTVTSVINPPGTINHRNDSGQTVFPYTVADGGAAIDLDVQRALIQNTGAISIVKNGPGLMRLSGPASTYTGATTINGGTLQLGTNTSTINNSTSLTVAAGAVFDTAAVTAGYAVQTGRFLQAGDSSTAADIVGDIVLNSGTGEIRTAGVFNAGTLTINGNLALNGGVLPVDYVSGALDAIHLDGLGRTLTLAGTNVIKATAQIPVGTYTLIDNFASVTGTASNFSFSGVRGAAGTVSVNATDVKLDVTSAGTPGNLVWSGTTSGVWDINTTANWNAGADLFFNYDAVVFNDTATTKTVTIAGMVGPSSIHFTNATTAYIMRGGTSPVIAGAGSLDKSGAGVLTLWHPSNTYSGGTTITGPLTLNNGATVATGTYTPLGTGAITIGTGGTLRTDPGNGGGNTYTFPNAVNLNGGTFHHQDGNVVIGGAVTVQQASSLRTLYGGKNLTLAGGLAGSAAVVVSNGTSPYGSGTVILSAAGSYSGQMTINNAGGDNSSVTLTNPGALTNAQLVINTTAVNDSYAYNPLPVGLILAGTDGNNYTIASLSGSQSLASIHNANDSGTRTLTVNQSTDTIFSGVVGGSTDNRQRLNLVKNGSGSLTLAGANTYTGNTTVNAGTLVMNARGGASNMDITVASGATLGIKANANSSMIVDEVTTGNSTLLLSDLSVASPAPIDALTLHRNGATTINPSGNLEVGDYTLIKYGNTDGAGSFTLGTLPRGTNGYISDDGSSIILHITGTSSLVWKGTTASWDINTTAAWKMGTTDPDVYLDNDTVLFDDTAGSVKAVDVNATVQPSGITINGAADYSFGSTTYGIAGPTGIVKNGTGTTTINTANTFTGEVFVNGGTLKLGNAAALGAASSGVAIAAGGALDLNGITPNAEAVSLGGSLLNGSATAATFGGAITLAGNSLVGGVGNLSLTSGIAGDSSLSLEKTGAGTVTLTSASLSLYAPVTVAQGTLSVNVAAALQNAPLTVKNGATLVAGAENALRYHKAAIVVESGGILTNVNGVTSNIGPDASSSLTLQGGATFASGTPNPSWGSWTINTSGNKITVAGGAAQAALISANQFISGSSTLNLEVGDVTASSATDLVISGTLGSASSIAFGTAITGGGKVEMNGVNTNTGATTVDAASALGGTGTLPGALTAAGTVAPGSTATPVGTLNTGSATLTGTLEAGISGTDADKLAVTGDLTVTGATLAISGAATAPVYVLASWTGTLTGTFATVTGVPSGYSVKYDSTNKQIQLAQTTGYDTWASGYGLSGSDALRTEDPDKDGFTNLQEFLFGTSPVAGNGALLTTSASGGNLTLKWLQRESGCTYVLKESTTLQAGSWSTSAYSPALAGDQTGVPTDYDLYQVVIPTASPSKDFFRIEGEEN